MHHPQTPRSIVVHLQQPQADLRRTLAVAAQSCGAPTMQVLHPLPLPARSRCSHPFTRNTRPNQYIHTHHETAAPSAARMNNISTTPFHAEWGRSRAWARGEGEVGGLVSPAVVAFVLFVRPPVVMSGGGVDRLVLNPCAKEATRRRARVSRGVEGGGRRSGVRSRQGVPCVVGGSFPLVVMIRVGSIASLLGLLVSVPSVSALKR